MEPGKRSDAREIKRIRGVVALTNGKVDRNVLPIFQQVVNVFERNLARVTSLSLLPSALLKEGMAISDARTRVLLRRGPAAADDIYTTIDDAAIAEYLNPSLPSLPAPRIRYIPTSETFDAVAKRGCDAGFDALLAAVVCEMYAAFESMSENLWIAAVDHYPVPLVDRFVEKKDKGGQAISIEISRLKGFGYDPSRHMGRLLRDVKKVKFDSLNEIKRAYEKCFWNGVSAVFQDKDLQLASIVRNLYAHDGGVVNSDSADKLALHGLSFAPGDEFQLTGGFVVRLGNNLVTQAWKVIRALDDWARAMKRGGDN